MATADDRSHRSIEEFIEQMGLFFESENLPRIAGRLFGFMLLQEQPWSLDDLASELQVSKTSISTNARLLEQQGMIQRVARPGDRRDYYIASPDQTRTIELRLAGIRRMSDILGAGLTALHPDRAAARSRLKSMVDVNDEILELLRVVVARRRA